MAITLQQIAEACGVSRGTVDRALKGKSGIKPETAEHIIQTAQEMGYVSRKKSKNTLENLQNNYRIGVVLHSGNSDYGKMLITELRKTALNMASKNVELLIRYTDNRDIPHQARLIDELSQKESINGLAIMPLASDLIRKKLNELSLFRGIPIVTLNTDMAETARIAYVGPNSVEGGRAAASLLGMILREKGKVLAIAGQPGGHYADRQRLTGFMEEIEKLYPEITVLSPEYCFSDPLLTERTLTQQLKLTPDITGIYIAAAGQQGAYRALQKVQTPQRIKVVTHDLTPDNLEMVEKGILDFALGQDVQTQGKLPIHILYKYLLTKKEPKTREFITKTQIKFKYNL